MKERWNPGERSSVGESEVDWKAVLFGRGDIDNSLRTQSEKRAMNEWDRVSKAYSFLYFRDVLTVCNSHSVSHIRLLV